MVPLSLFKGCLVTQESSLSPFSAWQLAVPEDMTVEAAKFPKGCVWKWQTVSFIIFYWLANHKFRRRGNKLYFLMKGAVCTYRGRNYWW